MADDFAMDRTRLSVGDLHGPDPDRDDWLTRSDGERLEAVELVRQILYGYDPATERLQRVLEMVERTRR